MSFTLRGNQHSSQPQAKAKAFRVPSLGLLYTTPVVFLCFVVPLCVRPRLVVAVRDRKVQVITT